MCRELIITFCLLSNFSFAQDDHFRGFLYEQNSRLPIPNAHIRIKDTDMGNVSGADGSFNIHLTSLPSILEISCLGYESLILEISKIQKSTVVLFLKPKTYDLNTLTVSDKLVITLYKDEDYSVLDYNFLGDNLILLVFRYQLRRSELILMTTDGDTLSVVPPPAVPPLGLYKDVLSNLHFITKKKEAFQCVYFPAQGQLGFPYHTTYDTILRFLGRYRFLLQNRLFFLEHSPRGFMTSFGYYSRDEGRKYAHKTADYKGRRTFFTDAVNYHTFRPIPDPIDENERRSVDAEAITYEHFYKKKTCGDLFRISDSTMAFFDFCGNRLEILNADGHLISQKPIDFHKEQTQGWLTSITTAFLGDDQWKWNKTLLQDEVFQNIYAVFSSGGFIGLKKIDLETGTLGPLQSLPFIFPEKIKLFRGDAYFLTKDIGPDEKWKLFKVVIK